MDAWLTSPWALAKFEAGLVIETCPKCKVRSFSGDACMNELKQAAWKAGLDAHAIMNRSQVNVLGAQNPHGMSPAGGS